MASYLFTNYLKKNDPNIFNVLLNSFRGDKDELETMLKSGKLSKDKFPNWRDEDLSLVQSKLSINAKDIYSKLSGSDVKEADLTDEELQERLESFQGLGGTPETTNLQKIKDDVKAAFGDVGLTLSDTSLNAYSNFILTNKRLPTDTEAKSGGDRNPLFNASYKLGDIRNKFNILVNDRFAKNEYVSPEVNYSEDITRITDALTTRELAKEKDLAINQYVEGIQPELEESREDFMAGEEDRAYRELERQVPLTLQNLNVRGMLYSGEREDELSSKALNLSSSLEQIQFDLEEEDNQFYYDFAYKNALRKDLKASSDYQGAITENRGKILTERGQRYQSYQTTLNQQLEEELTKSNYRRQLASYQRKLSQAQKDKDEAVQEKLLTGIAQAGTSLAVGSSIG